MVLAITRTSAYGGLADWYSHPETIRTLRRRHHVDRILSARHWTRQQCRVNTCAWLDIKVLSVTYVHDTDDILKPPPPDCEMGTQSTHAGDG